MNAIGAVHGAAILLLLIAGPANGDAMPDGARSSIPSPDIEAASWMLVEHRTGWVLAEHQADEKVEPASLSKLMTAYIVFSRLREGQLTLDEVVHVSEKAWRTEGSRMFIRVDTRVSVQELLQGLIVQSGNDAAVALAEHVAGSENAFVALMNEAAARLGLTNTQYRNSTGLPDEEHYSSARDLSTLTSALIREFPDYYRWYSQREFTYNDITQQNRNVLLWRDETVDGVKTGHTKTAGYCLIGSAARDNMRLVATVIGARSKKARADAVHSLLKHGFAAYENRVVFDANQTAAEVDVLFGTERKVAVGVTEPLRITIPKDSFKKLRAEIEVREGQKAPISRSQVLGAVRLVLNESTIAEHPVVALADVPEGPWWQRVVDGVRLWFK